MTTTPNPAFGHNDQTLAQLETPPYDLMGWGDNTLTPEEKIDLERRRFEKLVEDMPLLHTPRQAISILPAIQTKFNQLQKDAGFSEGSYALHLLDKLVFGKHIDWLPQIIGSCVESNTFREWVNRLLFQIGMKGNAEEYFGTNEFGPKNLAPYGPFSYGMARKRANMRGGDGLYGSAMAETLTKDGRLMCNTPKLLEILKSLGADREKDFPEPQNARIYRAFGDWKYLDELKPYADFRCLSCPKVNSADDIIENSKAFRPMFQCSSIAIKKSHVHKDGITIFTQNKRDRWDHNMGISGFIILSDGKMFSLISNKSWPGSPVYPVDMNEVAGWYKAGKCETYAIDEIDAPDSAIPQM